MPVLLFDYDGVIADSLKFETDYLLPIFKRKKVDGLSTAQDLVDLCEANIFENLKNFGVPVNVYLDSVEEFQEHVTKNDINASPYPGMIDLLRFSASQFPVYIVTSNIRRFPEEMMSSHNVDEIKDILGTEVEHSKIKKINSIKDKYPREQVYFITDTKGDIDEARDSNADFIIGVSWGWHSRELLEESNPNLILDEVGELKKFIYDLIKINNS